MIKHEPIFDTDKICKHFAKKDGVPIRYVCSTALGSESFSVDVFYRETPHPEFGNRYFGIYDSSAGNGIFICNADVVEKLEFTVTEDDEGNLRYSRHRHDFLQFKNGNMIDGGRAYVRYSGKLYDTYVIRDGEMVKS